MICRSVHVMYRGRRMIYTRCTLQHHPADDNHFDSFRNFHWTAPRLLEGEWEPGKQKSREIKDKRCPTCLGWKRHVDHSKECTCWDHAKVTRGQADMFKVSENQESMNEMERDIEWIQAEHAAMWEKFIDEQCDGYRGEF